jgi:hypothetical protein
MPRNPSLGRFSDDVKVCIGFNHVQYYVFLFSEIAKSNPPPLIIIHMHRLRLFSDDFELPYFKLNSLSTVLDLSFASNSIFLVKNICM